MNTIDMEKHRCNSRGGADVVGEMTPGFGLINFFFLVRSESVTPQLCELLHLGKVTPQGSYL